MNEMIIEKLIQKINTAIEEVMNLNLLVRNLPPSGEMMNQLHTRINAMQASLAQMEKVVAKDNENVKVLQSHYGEVKAALNALQNEVSNLNKRSQESLLDVGKGLREEGGKREKDSKTLLEQLENMHYHMSFGRVVMYITLIVLVVLGIKVLS
jgi:chromosome segregation ATPase